MQRSKKRVEIIEISKQVIMKAEEEDLITVWEATSESGRWDILTGVTYEGFEPYQIELGLAEWEILKRECIGWCADICPNLNQRDENGKIVDCGLERLEEIWLAGQNS